ncbi:DUF6329 domain-containing protein [Clostridium sp. DL1XJH146]
MKKALFGRKIYNMKELKELTQEAIETGKTGQTYIITREVILNEIDFKRFSENFLRDQPWISSEDGGMNEKGEILCIRVKHMATGETVLVNSEGYDYPRYTGLEL